MHFLGWINFAVILIGLPATLLTAYKAVNFFRDNTKLVKMDARISNTEHAIQAVLHDSLYKQCMYCIKKGAVTVSELDNIEHLFSGYKGVGGNGTGEALYNKVLALPVDKEEE